MDFETLRYEAGRGLARLTLDRPDAMNGMTNQMVREARMTLADFVGDEAERHLRIATGDDTAEAFRAFVDQREPRFS